MPKRKKSYSPLPSEEVLLRLQSSDPAISGYIDKLRSRYGKYTLPIEEARRIIDKSMGKQSLSAVLYHMREEEF